MGVIAVTRSLCQTANRFVGSIALFIVANHNDEFGIFESLRYYSLRCHFAGAAKLIRLLNRRGALEKRFFKTQMTLILIFVDNILVPYTPTTAVIITAVRCFYFRIRVNTLVARSTAFRLGDFATSASLGSAARAIRQVVRVDCLIQKRSLSAIAIHEF